MLTLENLHHSLNDYQPRSGIRTHKLTSLPFLVATELWGPLKAAKTIKEADSKLTLGMFTSY